MRTAALMLVCFVAFSAANAQKFSLLPHVGVEASKTKISYNGLPYFSPLCAVFSPSMGLRLNYASKQGHGFFLGAVTSRSTVSYQFTDPEKGMDSYNASVGNMQIRMEGGYRFTSKPIYFGKTSQSSSAKASVASTPEKKKTCGYNAYKSSCSKTYAAYACSRTGNKSTWMKIQPSAGIGFIPGTPSDVVTKTTNGQPVYEYRAGNWNTAFITGADFEFGKGSYRLFTVSINYFKGIGNLNTQTLSTQSDAKNVTTTLRSTASGWNMQVGIPLTLGAKKSTVKPAATQKITEQPKSRCEYYKLKYQCRKMYKM